MTQYMLILALFTGQNYTQVTMTTVPMFFGTSSECDAAGQKARRDFNNPATWVSYSCVARTAPG